MLRKLFALGCLFMTVGAVGCGSSKAQDAPATGPKYPALSDFCNAVAAAECSTKIVNACVTGAGACPTAVNTTCLNGALDFEPGTDGLAHYNNGKAEACVDKLTAAYATQSIAADTYRTARSACQLVFSQSNPTGFACHSDFDCDQDNNEKCVFTAATTGACQVPKMIAKGDDCSAAGSVCPDGYHCTAADQICGVIKKANGDACSNSDPCATGSICDGIDPATGMGACAALHAQADPCSTDSQCATGLFCAGFASGSECAAELDFAKGSDSCKAIGGN